MYTCKICGNSEGNKAHIVREMMFGFRDKFEYFECAKCKCLQINNIPDDLSKYYPSGYYSFKKAQYDTSWRLFFKQQLAKYSYGKGNFVGFLLSKKYGAILNSEWFKHSDLRPDSKIMDLGCGAGKFLLNMRMAGFTELTGVDPFIEKDIIYDNGVRILKREAKDIDEQFDFISMHHSFEHVPDPLSTLKEVYRLLKPGRIALIRMPVASCFAWREYGVNWVQLDAPRHLFLQTRESMQILAKQAGFQIKEVVYDSTALQFWGSEQYIKDIPLFADNSYEVNKQNSIFTKSQIADYGKKAKELNLRNEGDAAFFFLYKP